jgi:hypothetical protein
MTRIDTSSSVRAMGGPTITIPVSVRLRATVAAWVRRPYLQAIAVYLAVRVVGVVVLAIMAAHHNLPLLDRLTAWDGQWYSDLADHGYGGITDRTDAHGQVLSHAPWAFFPLYPAFTALVSGLPGVSIVAAALIVSLLSGVAAACALVRIGRRFYPHRPVGLILVALWAGAPMAITLSMAYTEAMFVAFAAWALVGVLEQRWWLAQWCSVFAGLTRSTASVLIAVVVVAAGVAVYRGGRGRWPALACALVAPAGLLGFWAAVATQTGSPTGWWDLERQGWNTRFDFGVDAGKYIVQTLSSDKSVMQTITVLIVLAAVALAVVAVTTRLPWPLAVYGIGVVVLAVGTAGLPWEKARFVLPAVTLLIPVALGLTNRKPSTIVATVVAWMLIGAWFSGNSLTAWQHSI